jgi:hypothetical protein
MVTKDSSGILVTFYGTGRRHIPEERDDQCQGVNLRSQNSYMPVPCTENVIKHKAVETFSKPFKPMFVIVCNVSHVHT